MSSASQYLTNLVAQAAGRVCSFGLNFLVFVLIARIGGTEFFGRYSYVITFLNVFVQFADFGMTSVLGKDIAQARDDDRSYWGNFLTLKVVFSLAATILAMVAAYVMRRDLLLVLCVGSIFIPFLSARFFEPIFQVYGKPWLSAYSSALYGGVSLIFFLVALSVSGDLLAVVFAFVLANTVYAVLAYCLARRLVKPDFTLRRDTLKKILLLTVPLGVSAVFTIVTGRAPVFMLAAMKSDYAVGMFNASYRLFDLFVMTGAILVGPFIPILSAKALDDLASLKRISTMTVELIGIFGAPFAIVVTFGAPFLLTLVFGDSFLPSAPALGILMWTGVLVFLSLFTSAVVLAIGVVHFAYWNTAIAALISILLNYLWIPAYSFVGSAWATMLCEVFLSGTTVLYLIRHLGNIFQVVPWAKIVGSNLVLLAILFFGSSSGHLLLAVSGGIIVYGALIIISRAFPWNAVRLAGEMMGRLRAGNTP